MRARRRMEEEQSIAELGRAPLPPTPAIPSATRPPKPPTRRSSSRYQPQFKTKVLNYILQPSTATTAMDMDTPTTAGPSTSVKTTILSAAHKFSVHPTTLSSWLLQQRRQAQFKNIQQEGNTPPTDQVLSSPAGTVCPNSSHASVEALERKTVGWLGWLRLELSEEVERGSSAGGGYLLKYGMSDISHQLNKYLLQALNNKSTSSDPVLEAQERSLILSSWMAAWAKRLHESEYNDRRGQDSLLEHQQQEQQLMDLIPNPKIIKEKKAKKHLFLLAKVGKVPRAEATEPKKKRRQNVKTKRRNAKLRKQKASQGSDSDSATEEDDESGRAESGQDLKCVDADLKRAMAETRRKRLLEDNEEEEKNIRSLEKKLKLNKKAAIPESFRVDGLDYLLEFCDQLDTSKESKKVKSAEEEEELGSSSGAELDDEDMEFESEGSDNDMIELEKSTEDQEGSEGEDEGSESEVTGVEKKADLWEDIYGRMRDGEGNVIDEKGGGRLGEVEKKAIVVASGKYVPPVVRRAGGSSISGDTIKKSLKGLLNRLSESNMHRISAQIEELYMGSSRNEMNEGLLELLNAALVGPVLSSERILLEHVMLIAILHANVGTEIGAFFIQSFVSHFHSLYEQVESLENNHKELENLTLLVSFMYHFKVVDSGLLYDLLNFLAQTFTAKDIELILAILRSVGFRLRKDDPAALKSLILILQQKATTSSKSGSQSSRVKFMLDILLAIRNNNMNKIPNYDPSYPEHLNKIIKTHFHKGNYVAQLKISMQDLLNAETRGKWWLVGSAWTHAAPAASTTAKAAEPGQASSLLENQKLLAKARAQGMNTETRRNIFCILMTAEDYLDAFEKLVHLGLKNQLEREIVHVLIHCCLQEKKFNPYYAYLASKFCQLERRFVLTIQYTIWDRLKELDGSKEVHESNLSRFLVHLVNDRSLPLTVLKVIDFADMSSGKLSFLRKTLAGILLHKSAETVEEIFSKVGCSDKLSLFRESLKLFIAHFMLKDNSSKTLDGTNSIQSFEPKTLAVLKERVKLAQRAMSLGISKVQF